MEYLKLFWEHNLDIEITSIPTVDELNFHIWGEEIHACLIDKEEFEKIWKDHFYDGCIGNAFPKRDW